MPGKEKMTYNQLIEFLDAIRGGKRKSENELYDEIVGSPTRLDYIPTEDNRMRETPGDKEFLKQWYKLNTQSKIWAMEDALYDEVGKFSEKQEKRKKPYPTTEKLYGG